MSQRAMSRSDRFKVRIFTADGVWDRYALPAGTTRAEQRLQKHTAQEALADVGIDVPAAELDRHWRVFDCDGSGLGYRGFLQLVEATQERHEALTLAELRKMMDALDKDKTGVITVEEFRKLWKDKMSAHEIDDLVVAADRNFDGNIDFEEFCHLMCPETYTEEVRAGRISPRSRRSASPQSHGSPSRDAVREEEVREAFSVPGTEARAAQEQRAAAAAQAKKCIAELRGHSEALAESKEKTVSALGRDWSDPSVRAAVAEHAETKRRVAACQRRHSGIVGESLSSAASRRDRLSAARPPLTINKDNIKSHQDLQKAYQFRTIVGEQVNVVPPGLTAFDEGKHWVVEEGTPGGEQLRQRWNAEASVRRSLAKTFGDGLSGAKLDGDTAGHRRCHALGVRRRFDGKAISASGDVAVRQIAGATPRIAARGGHAPAAAATLWVSSAPTLTAESLSSTELDTAEYLDGVSVFEMLGITPVDVKKAAADPQNYEIRWVSCGGKLPGEGGKAAPVSSLGDAKAHALKAGCCALQAEGIGQSRRYSLCQPFHKPQDVLSGADGGGAVLWVAVGLTKDDAAVLDGFDGSPGTITPSTDAAARRVASATATGASIRHALSEGPLGAQAPEGSPLVGQQPYGNHVAGHLSEAEAAAIARDVRAQESGEGIAGPGGAALAADMFVERGGVEGEEEAGRADLGRRAKELTEMQQRLAEEARLAAEKAAAEKAEQERRDAQEKARKEAAERAAAAAQQPRAAPAAAPAPAPAKPPKEKGKSCC